MSYQSTCLCRIAIRIVILSIPVLFVAGCKSSGNARNNAHAGANPNVNAEYKNADVNKWTDRFESESREVFRERQKIVDSLNIHVGQSVADIGAGTGVFTELLSERVGTVGHVYAVDVVPEFISHIKNLAAERKLKNVRAVLSSPISIKLPADSIDHAFVCDTYHHLETPRNMLASIYRALRPGGKLVIVDFERIPGVSREWILEHVRCGRDQVIKEVTAAGFELDPTDPDVPYLDENYILRFCKPIEDGFLPPKHKGTK